MKLRGALKHLTPWSDAELAVLAERYARDGGAAVAEATGRSLRSVYIQAGRRGLCHEKWWTPAEDANLRNLWLEMALKGIATKLGRSQGAVAVRAAALGLKLGAPEGWEFLTTAEGRVGYRIPTIRRIVEWAEQHGILNPRWPTIKIAMHAPRAAGKRQKWRRHIVEIDSLDDALAAWMQAETIEEAARARGTSRDLIVRALSLFATDAPGRTVRGAQWRLPSDVIDGALAARAAHESLVEAALRVGLSRDSLKRRLRLAGLKQPPRHNWYLRPADVDAAISRAA